MARVRKSNDPDNNPMIEALADERDLIMGIRKKLQLDIIEEWKKENPDLKLLRRLMNLDVFQAVRFYESCGDPDSAKNISASYSNMLSSLGAMEKSQGNKPIDDGWGEVLGSEVSDKAEEVSDSVSDSETTVAPESEPISKQPEPQQSSLEASMRARFQSRRGKNA